MLLTPKAVLATVGQRDAMKTTSTDVIFPSCTVYKQQRHPGQRGNWLQYLQEWIEYVKQGLRESDHHTEHNAAQNDATKNPIENTISV